MIDDLNPESKPMQTATPPPALVSLTPSAKDYLSSVIPTNATGGPVSLGVKGGGCSGLQYVWDFANNWPDVRWSDPIDDVLVLDPFAEVHVIGCVIDYVSELGGSFLKIVNPNAVSSCGCGESFNT